MASSVYCFDQITNKGEDILICFDKKKEQGMTQTYLQVAASHDDAGCETGLSSKYVKVCFSAMLVVLLSSSFFLEPFVHCFDKNKNPNGEDILICF